MSLTTSDSTLPSSGMSSMGSTDHLGRGGGHTGSGTHTATGENGTGKTKGNGKGQNLFKKVYDMSQALVRLRLYCILTILKRLFL